MLLIYNNLNYKMCHVPCIFRHNNSYKLFNNVAIIVLLTKMTKVRFQNLSSVMYLNLTIYINGITIY